MRTAIWALALASCQLPTSKGPGTTAGTSDPGHTTPTTSTAPPGTGTSAPATCGFTPAPDLDPDPDVVEVAVTADEADWDPGTGTPLHGVAFGGVVPGPTIELVRGQTLRFRFTNDTDEATTLHWHGLRVPEAMDGVEQMSDPVQPGQTFVYEFPVLDSGLYWYHPHMDTAQAIERGLYGLIVVHEPGEEPPACDLPVALDDVLLDRSGQIAPEGSEMQQEMGRLGNLLLANGRSDLDVPVVAGSTVLLRLVNAANARYFDLRLDDLPLTVVGTDGGFVSSPWTVDHLLVAPGERYLVQVDVPDEPGRALALTTRSVSLHQGGMGGMMDSDPLGDGEHRIFVLEVVPGDPGPAWAPPHVAIDALASGPVAHHWMLGSSMMRMGLTIDGQTWPDVPPVVVNSGSTTFVVDNRSTMRHPIHFHGNRFQLLERNGVPVPFTAWKDTFDVPAGETITIASELDNPGDWLYHCHILEHADNGMAGIYSVR